MKNRIFSVTRCRILKEILNNESMKAGEISEKLNIKPSALSHILKELSANKILVSEKIGAAVIYKISPEKIEKIQSLISLFDCLK